MSSSFFSALRNARADFRVTYDEWKTAIKPKAEATPREASVSARMLARLFAQDALQLDEGVRQEARDFLLSRGYEAPPERPPGVSPNRFATQIIRSNITETDTHFSKLQARAGRMDETCVVAVLDSGWEHSHPALRDNLWTNPREVAGDGRDNDRNGLVDDVHGWDFVEGDSIVDGAEDDGHATHVAGLATRGTPNIDAIAIRAFSPVNGVRIASAIDYAAANGARVMNMSFRVQREADVGPILDAMRRHPEVLFVASAGNDGRQLHTYEASSYLKKNELPNFAVISSANPDGTVASYSNRGAPYSTHAARGTDVVSSVPGQTYAAKSGTSMAAPIVTGTAAKMLILDPGLTPAQQKAMLTLTSDLRADWASLTDSGGLVNEERVLSLAALTGLMRSGMRAAEAAAQLQLGTKERETLIPLAQRFV